MQPNSTKTNQYLSLGSNGVDRVRSLRKFQCDLMAQTCPLIAPVQPILHRVPCSNETLPNAPKHYEMLQNMSLDPVGWIECVLCKKIPMRLYGTNLCINCTQTLKKTHQNMSLGYNGVDRVHSLQKILMRVRGTNFCFNCTSSAYFASIFMQK